MLARCLGLASQAAMTARALAWPRATFSAQPLLVSQPARRIRSPGSLPSLAPALLIRAQYGGSETHRNQ
jgi:hypothetical protein